MSVFVKKSVKEIYAQTWRKQTELRKSCTEVLEELEKPKSDETLKKETYKFIKPFELAMKTKTDKMVDISIDCLQKLMAFGYITNDQQISDEKSLLDVVVDLICGSFENEQSDQVQLQIIKALLTSVTTSQVTGASLRGTIKTCFNICLVTKNADNVRTAKAALTQMLNKVFQRMETFNSNEEYISNYVKNIISNVIASTTESSFSNAQRDAYFIFRALCRLSTKPVPNNASSDSIEMRSRILSLQLISSVLTNSGPVFRASYSFIQDIRQTLCLSLLNNVVSTNPKIFNISLSVFKTLFVHFKDHLKVEIATFLDAALLKILRSPNSTYQHKFLVIQVIATIVQDPQTVVDLFVNYDSGGMEYSNIFEHIVHEISTIIQVSFETNWVTSEQEEKMKNSALKAIVTLLRSMVNWTQKIQKTKPIEETISEVDEVKQPSQAELLEIQRNLKRGYQEGIREFNASGKHGIKYMITHQLIKDTPDDIAKFLFGTEGLDKKEIGNYIGTKKFVDVLEAYVRLFDFTNVAFVAALREFLNHFRLPGEGQMIDQIVQKFAGQYYRNNNTGSNTPFNNADACYVFAYAVIMLNTELHNPSLSYRDRMDLAGFMRNNEGLNQTDDGTPQDFGKEFQEHVFNDIKDEEIKMKGEEEITRIKETSELLSKEKDVKKKYELFGKQGDLIFQETRNQLSESWDRHFDETYYYSSEIGHIPPMWTVSWAPILSALSIFFEKTENLEAAKLCLEGFQYGIHLSAMFDMHVQRDTYVNALSKFSGLTNLSAMKEKNAEAINLMINIAQQEGNFLKSSWSVFLNAMSKVDRLVNVDHHTKGMKKKQTSTAKMDRKVSMDISSSENTDQFNSQFLTSRIDLILIDKLYQRSTSLENDAIVEFVKCLCEVSSDEIFSQNDSRTYSLHKLIEVAYYNIDRMKLVWGKIWSSVSQHFIDIACKHGDLQMIMGAIDSLRQLSMRFLEQPEDSNFHFQRDFMKPFVHIINESKNPEIRVLIVEICNRMILSRGENIKSGWKSIFKVFQTAASDKGIVLECAFNNMDVIMKDYFDRIIIAFPDFVKCLSIFGGNQSDSTISIQAIDHLRKCAKHISTGKVVSIEQNEIFTIDKKFFVPWFAVFTGTSLLIDDSRSQIRLKALTSLFDILDTHSKQFDTELWAAIFKGVLYPIFSNIEKKNNREQWIKDTSEKSLKLLVGLFSKYFDFLKFEFSNMMKLFGEIIDQKNEILAKIVNSCLVEFCIVCGDKLTKEQWDEISELLCHFSVKYSTSLGITENQCRNQLITIETINEIAFAHYKVIEVSHLVSLIKTLDLIYTSSAELYQLKSSNEMKQILLRQRLESMTIGLNILLKMFSDEKRTKDAEPILIEKYTEIFHHYEENMTKNSPMNEHVIVPLMVLVLTGIHSFSDEQFSTYGKHFFSNFSNLIVSNHPIVQEVLKDIFMKIGTNLLNI
eukprot:gene2329-2797_t